MDGIERYMYEIERHPQLDGAWFGPTLEGYRRGDPAAREAITVSCLRLIPPIAKEFRAGSDLSLADLIEEGNAAIQTSSEKVLNCSELPVFIQCIERAVRVRLSSLSTSAEEL